jgi:hypothetical protein
VLDAYLRDRAKKNGAKVYNGLFLRSSQKDGPEGAFTVNFSDYTDGGKVPLLGAVVTYIWVVTGQRNVC